MSDPKRWLDPSSGAPSFERELLRAGKKLSLGAGAEEHAWTEFQTLLGPPTGGGAGSDGGAGGSAGPGSSGVAGSAAALTAGKTATVINGLLVGAGLALGGGALFAGARWAISPTPVHSVPATPLPAAVRSFVPPPHGVARDPSSLSPRVPMRTAEPERQTTALAIEMGPSASLSPPDPEPGPIGRAALPDLPGPSSSFGQDLALARERENVLKAEAMELASAKNLLANGQAGPALTLLAQSARRFPAGALAHERELLTVEALVRSGRPDLAGRRARAFISAHPESPLVGPMMNLVRRE